MTIPLLSSTATNAEASQIIGTINGVIQQLNEQALMVASAPTSLRNAVIGGDFGTNPWQRTVTFTGIANTAAYTADRFFAIGGASSSISVSRQTGTPTPGFEAHARFGRASSNADTAAIKLGQVLTSANSVRFQGQPFVISFYARSGADFSAASAALGVAVATGTGSDESASAYAAGSWTGQAAVQLYNSAGAQASSVAITSSFARYTMSGVIPTAATQIGFNFAYTPVGTAGASDYVEITGVQLEVMPQGGQTATPFEWRPASFERMLCQHYYYRATEGGTATKPWLGQANTTQIASILVPFPVPMRTITTVGLSTTTATVGSQSLTAAAGTVTSTLSSLVVTSGSATDRNMTLTATLAAAGLTAGHTTYLIGGGGTGTIAADAEL